MMLYFILLLAVLVWFHAPEACHGRRFRPQLKEESYAVLIDAGSTGSRMHVYKFQLNNRGKVTESSDVHELHHSLGKVRPALSSFAQKTEGIPKYLTTFTDEAKKIVPNEKWASAPFLLVATAGLRGLSTADQKTIMNKVDEFLENKAFSPFRFENDFAKLLSVEEEAVFGWITINFLLGVLTKPKRRPTYAALDMGGASTQNAFHYPSRKPEGRVNLNLNGKSYSLFAKSYFDMGLARVHDLYLEFLVNWPNKTRDDKGYMKSPCHHSGFRDIFQNVGPNMGGVRIVGQPNSDKCRQIIDVMFFCKGSLPCLFRDQPVPRGGLLAFSAFYTIIDRIGALICDKKPVSVEQIGCAARKFSLTPYKVVKPIDEGYVKFSCLWGNYIYELLREGYRFSEDKKILVAKELNGFALSWTLGAVLRMLNLL